MVRRSPGASASPAEREAGAAPGGCPGKNAEGVGVGGSEGRCTSEQTGLGIKPGKGLPGPRFLHGAQMEDVWKPPARCALGPPAPGRLHPVRALAERPACARLAGGRRRPHGSWWLWQRALPGASRRIQTHIEFQAFLTFPVWH